MSCFDDDDILKAFEKTKAEFCFPGGELRLITDERRDEVLEGLKAAFLADEPLEKSLGLKWCTDIVNMWNPVLDQKISLMVVNKENDEIMGFRCIRITKQGDHFDINDITEKDVKKMIAFFAYMDEKLNFFEHYGKTELFEFFGLGVVPNYRRRGLGTVLMKIGIEFVRNLGGQNSVIKGSASSNFSQKIYDKCDFEKLIEFKIEEYKVDGKTVFDKTGEHKMVKAYGKLL